LQKPATLAQPGASN